MLRALATGAAIVRNIPSSGPSSFIASSPEPGRLFLSSNDAGRLFHGRAFVEEQKRKNLDEQKAELGPNLTT